MKEIKTVYKMIIPFYDVDVMQIVWHGNYVKYAEEARCDFFKKINYGYQDMKKDGVMYPIAKMDLKFIAPAVFGQKIVVKTILKEIEPAIIFKYVMEDEISGEKLCIVNSLQIGVELSTKETLYKVPKKFSNAISEFTKNV